ncbi:MAG: hypothetical protein GF370_03765 [Candidatus Nealsonbacteria bacterium]|nr:hypothetical protein [Candidatus Nealsonbacteria bacterium]
MEQQSNNRPSTAVFILMIALLAGTVGGIIYFQSDSQLPEERPVVNPPDKEINFSQQGNLVRDNPGLKPDTWYLVYERPGEPGLTKELIFNQESICMNGVREECVELLTEEMIGERVMVKGIDEDDAVLVKELTFLAG